MSDLPIFFQLLIASFVIALVFSAIWVYLVPEKPTNPVGKDEEQQEEDQDSINIEAFRSRRQAQERLFAHLQDSKQQRQARQEMNAQPYETDLLPKTGQTLTLYALFDQNYDVYRALVYLQADEIAISPEQFNDYWATPQQSFWAWQGDNILEPYGEDALKQIMRERYAQMKAVLLVSGWRLLRENQTDFKLISCYEIAR